MAITTQDEFERLSLPQQVEDNRNNVVEVDERKHNELEDVQGGNKENNDIQHIDSIEKGLIATIPSLSGQENRIIAQKNVPTPIPIPETLIDFQTNYIIDKVGTQVSLLTANLFQVINDSDKDKFFKFFIQGKYSRGTGGAGATLTTIKFFKNTIASTVGGTQIDSVDISITPGADVKPYTTGFSVTSEATEYFYATILADDNLATIDTNYYEATKDATLGSTPASSDSTTVIGTGIVEYDNETLTEVIKKIDTKIEDTISFFTGNFNTMNIDERISFRSLHEAPFGTFYSFGGNNFSESGVIGVNIEYNFGLFIMHMYKLDGTVFIVNNLTTPSKLDIDIAGGNIAYTTKHKHF